MGVPTEIYKTLVRKILPRNSFKRHRNVTMNKTISSDEVTQTMDEMVTQTMDEIIQDQRTITFNQRMC